MRKLVVLFLLATCLKALAQSPFPIEWEEERPLTWKDFKAAPDAGSSFHATTNSGISFTWSMTSTREKDDLVWEVGTSFHPELSWVKAKEKSDHLLAHEQLHFDISELHSRKLRKALSSYKITKNIKKELKAIYQRVQAERLEMQKRFDRETNHSQHEEMEVKWRHFVDLELEKLEDFRQ